MNVLAIETATDLSSISLYLKDKVVETFKEKGLTEDDALINARLARILTVDDYDFTTKKPIPWTPKADYRIDGGAGSKVKAAV